MKEQAFEKKHDNGQLALSGLLVDGSAADGQPVSLTIQKNRHGHMVDILITYPDWYYRVHLEAPFFFNNMRNV